MTTAPETAVPPETLQEQRQGVSLGRVLRSSLGVVLVMFAVVPMYRLLDPAETGLAGEVTVSLLDIQFDTVWAGLLLMVPVAIVGALFLPETTLHRFRAMAHRFASIRIVPFAATVAMLAAGLGVVFSLVVLQGLPNNIDAFAQLLHASFWAEGRFAGPNSGHGEFWMIQNSLFTDRGWVSQYPPGHVLVLAAFLKLGIPWAAGPVLIAVAVFFLALGAARLLPDDALAVRLGALLLAVSPFFIPLGASYMNHITSAAFICVGAWALVSAWHGTALWALVSGATFGWSLMTRPLATVAMVAPLAILIPFVVDGTARTPRRFAAITTCMVVGSLPFVAFLMWYNSYFFGSVARFGYEVALGPQMSLGFHRDPWGNMYGLREAIAYTSADLMALGTSFLESPISIMIVIGIFFIAARRFGAGERVIAAWALVPVLANFSYWHHGIFMGPRMLHEAAPAWALLLGLATSWVIRRADRRKTGKRYDARSGAAFALVVSLVGGVLVLAPQRAYSYGGSWLAVARTPLPDVDEPSLVFVHDAWMGRVAMTLASHGYRLDYVETLMRQNSTCSVQRLAEAVAADDVDSIHSAIASLDTVPRASGDFPVVTTISPANPARFARGEVLDANCRQQMLSDARGIIDIAPLAWRGDRIGGAREGALIVRDQGPSRNAELIHRYPDRRAYVYMMPSTDATRPILVEYDQGMALLWNDHK